MKLHAGQDVDVDNDTSNLEPTTVWNPKWSEIISWWCCEWGTYGVTKDKGTHDSAQLHLSLHRYIFLFVSIRTFLIPTTILITFFGMMIVAILSWLWRYGIYMPMPIIRNEIMIHKIFARVMWYVIPALVWCTQYEFSDDWNEKELGLACANKKLTISLLCYNVSSGSSSSQLTKSIHLCYLLFV